MAENEQIDARHVANWFVERAKEDGKVLSVMALLKLAYIAHGWHLEIHNKPLFDNEIEAWRYGPVILDLYESFRKQGLEVKTQLKRFPPAEIADDKKKILGQTYATYGKLSAQQLSNLTHIRGGPWDLATQVAGWYAHIPDALIRQHYVDKRARAEAAEASKRDRRIENNG